jgi:hypothetical protein
LKAAGFAIIKTLEAWKKKTQGKGSTRKQLSFYRHLNNTQEGGLE